MQLALEDGINIIRGIKFGVKSTSNNTLLLNADSMTNFGATGLGGPISWENILV